MKSLNGMKSVSTLENKKLNDLSTVQGGRRAFAPTSQVYSNFLNEQGGRDIDHYDGDGKWMFRGWDTFDCEVPGW